MGGSPVNLASGVRLCIPRPVGRGAGLGNELHPWAKSWLAARAIGGVSLAPAFGINARQYWKDFGTSRLDWLAYRALLRSAPRVQFSESDYLESGEVDFRRAVEFHAERRRWGERRFMVLEVEGMWGGFLAIREARNFVKGLLYGARGVQGNLLEWGKQSDPGKLTVAVHIRSGDFRQARTIDSYRGSFNVALPLSWYFSVCSHLLETFKGKVQFQLFTDGSAASLEPFIKKFQPSTGFHLEGSTCSDLLAMSSADLLVCSISTYSLWAAFLSEAPYIWFGPQLHQDQGLLSLWGHEATQRLKTSPTNQSSEIVLKAELKRLRPRGVAINADGALPPELIERLACTLDMKCSATDLTLYGVVPMSIA